MTYKYKMSRYILTEIVVKADGCHCAIVMNFPYESSITNNRDASDKFEVRFQFTNTMRNTQIT